LGTVTVFAELGDGFVSSITNSFGVIYDVKRYMVVRRSYSAIKQGGNATLTEITRPDNQASSDSVATHISEPSATAMIKKML
jgi:hypothetical protein